MAANDDDNFIDGVLIGAVVGTLVGGILGVLLAPRRRTLPAMAPEAKTSPETAAEMSESTNGSLESARRGLEEKLEQLNQAIEATRTKLTNNPGGDPPPTEPLS
jgi:gas vesicle protein